MTDQQVDWDCSAYGLKGRDAGALCFFAKPNERVCSSLPLCRTKMAAERERMFDRIHELAKTGDPTWKFLADAFTHPDQILNNDQGPDDSGDV